ncbi:chemokine XC receptor 1-like [Lepisosteus oculatus]|uniref:chemokine XC receptor 1-like n=1 Tax=Lepisosteus oculatus TaxID=7918 RepID=UPI003710067B
MANYSTISYTVTELPWSMTGNVSEDYYEDYSDDGGLVLLCEDYSPEFGGTFSSVCYLLIFCFSLIGNTLVLCTLIKYENLKKVTNIFILNLAVSDLIFSFSLPFWAVYHVHHWVFGTFMCQLLTGVFFIGFYSCMMFLMLMTVDRYLIVVHATTVSLSRRTFRATVASGIIWTICIGASLPESIFTETAESENGILCRSVFISITVDLVGVYLQISLFFLLPFVVIVYCYTRMIQTILSSRIRKKQKAVKLIFTLITGFFLCWAPYNVTLFLSTLRELNISPLTQCAAEQALNYAFYVCHNIAYLHCCLNPLFYVFVGVKFRQYLASMVCKVNVQERIRSQTFSSYNSAPRMSSNQPDTPVTTV